MKTLLMFTVVLSVTGSAWAGDEAKQGGAEKVRPCVVNFLEEGSFFKGKTYKTWQEYKGVEYDKAFRAVAQAVAGNSWGAVNSNKDLGIITAGQAVTMGEGAVAPLNVIVKEKAGVVRVETNFATGSMQKASTDTVRTELCKLVEAPGEQ